MQPSPARIPLQTGAGALTTVLFALALGAPAAGLAFAAVAAARSGLFPWYVPAGLALVFASVSARFVFRAARETASDLLLEPEGMRVEGGRLAGLYAAWRDIDFAIIQQGPVLVSSKHGKDEVTVQELRVGLRGAPIVLAESVDEDEAASLGVLAEAIARASQVAKGEPVRRPVAQSLLACPRCGAVAKPADADWVPCASCGAAVSVPEELRARLAASGEGDPNLERRLRGLLVHPGLARVNALILLATILVVAGLVAAVIAGTLRGAVLAAAPAALALPFAYRETTLRVGVRALLTGFAACSGATGAVCRCCGAPLATDGSRELARCDYCGAYNVVSLGLDRDLAQAEDDRAALEQLAARRFSSTVAVIAVAAAVCTAVVAVVVAR